MKNKTNIKLRRPALKHFEMEESFFSWYLDKNQKISEPLDGSGNTLAHLLVTMCSDWDWLNESLFQKLNIQKSDFVSACKIQNSDGRTPLHLAISLTSSNPKMVEIAKKLLDIEPSLATQSTQHSGTDYSCISFLLECHANQRINFNNSNSHDQISDLLLQLYSCGSRTKGGETHPFQYILCHESCAQYLPPLTHPLFADVPKTIQPMRIPRSKPMFGAGNEWIFSKNNQISSEPKTLVDIFHGTEANDAGAEIRKWILLDNSGQRFEWWSQITNADCSKFDVNSQTQRKKPQPSLESSILRRISLRQEHISSVALPTVGAIFDLLNKNKNLQDYSKSLWSYLKDPYFKSAALPKKLKYPIDTIQPLGGEQDLFLPTPTTSPLSHAIVSAMNYVTSSKYSNIELLRFLKDNARDINWAEPFQQTFALVETFSDNPLRLKKEFLEDVPLTLLDTLKLILQPPKTGITDKYITETYLEYLSIIERESLSRSYSVTNKPAPNKVAL